jgi:murein DD-endopeptidase MepM/ murein hydrolase activator NlpD
VDPEDNPKSGRSFSPLYKSCSVVAILILLFGGGWASISPTGKTGSGPIGADLELDVLSRRLAPDAMAKSGAEDCAEAGGALVRAARRAGIDPREELSKALPDAGRILGMLALDRDIDDFLEYADREDAAGDYYREEARLSLEMRPLRARYEAAFAAASGELSGSAVVSTTARKGKKPYIASPGAVWLPPRRQLSLSHPYALDIFFYNVERNAEAERGPALRALYPGLVVAAASDWSGGQGVATWKSGGLSPASGNGLVIFDPATRRYCSYFHLSSISFRAGDWVEAGALIGRGGNSGMNARMAGHGEHVHLEIFDSARGESLSAYELLDFLQH